MQQEHLIGQASQGGTILRARPRVIKLKDSGIVLELFSGLSIPLSKQITVRAGDYIGGGEHRTHNWMLQHSDQWEAIG